jgi:hypothetical protein
MSWHFLGIDLGRGENILKVAAAVILPEVILAVGTEILAATEIASGADFVSAIDAINSTTGLTGTEAAKIVGQSAFTAAATDGNLGDVLQNGLTAATGIQVDNIVTDAFDSALAGDVVRSATVAAIGNKDVGQAVALQLIPAGAGAAVGAITSRSTMNDTLFPTDEFAFGYDPNVDIFQNYVPTTGDVVVSPGDLGIDVAIAINESGLTTALDTNALFPDDSGVLYNEAGQAAVIPAELYAAGLYASIGPNGGVEVRGPDNLVLLTELQVAGAATTEQLAMLTEGAVQSRSGTTATSAPGPSDRPAGLTATAEKTTVSSILDFSKVAESLTKSLANIFTVVKQVENGTYGRVQSPYGSLNPYGTLRPQTPGVPVRNADGSVTVNNGNGTQTTTLANGQKVTIPTSTAGTFGGSVGGISTNTLLLVGAGLAAALLLRRK